MWGAIGRTDVGTRGIRWQLSPSLKHDQPTVEALDVKCNVASISGSPAPRSSRGRTKRLWSSSCLEDLQTGTQKSQTGFCAGCWTSRRPLKWVSCGMRVHKAAEGPISLLAGGLSRGGIHLRPASCCLVCLAWMVHSSASWAAGPNISPSSTGRCEGISWQVKFDCDSQIWQ